MLRTFNPPATVKLPTWARGLSNMYWVIRVEGRDKAKRLRYYRKVRKEKLRLVESGLSFEVVDAVCKYLIRFNAVAGNKLLYQLEHENPQLCLNFFDT